MNSLFEGLAFGPADILLPQNCQLEKWAVVACDQYTSQPEYWSRVERTVGGAPSSLRLILPEGCLDGPNVETDIVEVNNTMTRYLREGRFRSLENSLIYVERTLASGKVRKGLVGAVDLEQYDYEPGTDAPVRGAEGTVMGHIPPRVAARKNAPLELSHVLLLCDDPSNTVIKPLFPRKGEMELLYDFPLMEKGGHLRGWRLDRDSMALVADALHRLWSPDALRARYGEGAELSPFQLAVGDGNHALSAAKECYERQKRLTPPEKWDRLPSRYALCEMVNLYDEALRFEPIHRVVFGVSADHLLGTLLRTFPSAHYGPGKGSSFRYMAGDKMGELTIPYENWDDHEDEDRSLRQDVSIPHGEDTLPVQVLQEFLDWYVGAYGGSMDYIHGADVAARLGCRAGNVAFLLPTLDKDTLFQRLIRRQSLPRKAFSVGEANDKRFYLEARRIRI